MSGDKLRASGGASLLTERAVAELRESMALAKLVHELRQREVALACRLRDAGPAHVRFACESCIADMLGSEAALLRGADSRQSKEPESGAAMGSSAFAQTVFALRGAPKMALRRREARETARAYAYLSAETPLVPQRVRDFQTLWEIAQEGEPRLSMKFPSSEFRTGTSFIIDEEALDGCLRLNTSPENIVQELEELVAFLQDEALMSEARAAAAYASLMFTHPFDDGNGHAGRMLMLFAMAPGYSLLTNVCVSRTLAVRRKDLGDAVQLLYEGASTLAEFCLFALGLLRGTHREAAILLDSAR